MRERRKVRDRNRRFHSPVEKLACCHLGCQQRKGESPECVLMAGPGGKPESGSSVGEGEEKEEGATCILCLNPLLVSAPNDRSARKGTRMVSQVKKFLL